MTMATRSFLLAFSFAISTTAFAAAVDDTVPASKRDVKALERKMERQETRINKKIKEVSAEDVKVQGAARSADKAEHDGIETAIESATTATNNSLVDVKHEIRTAAAEISGCLALLAIGAFFVLRTRKGRNAKQPGALGIIPRREDVLAGKKPWNKFLNPEEDQLRKALMGAGLSEGLFIMTLPSIDPNTAPRVELIGIMIPNQNDLKVRVPGSRNLIAWKDKRRSKEVLEYAERNGLMSSEERAS